MPGGEQDSEEREDRLRSVVGLSLKLGITAFGGPAAHIAMLRHEVVSRRAWLTDQHFLDLLGVTNLIPGPNSTEMVMHVGQNRAGGRGLMLAGIAFIVPAATITMFFAWLYVRYGTTPRGEWLLDGIKPVIIAVVGQALWSLGRTAIKDVTSGSIAVGVLALYLAGANEIVLLFGGALLLVGLRQAVGEFKRHVSAVRGLAPVAVPSLMGLAAAAADAKVPYTALRLFLTFVKIGSVLYGSGYVLLAFLRNDFVVRYGWLTEQQLLDAVAVGQVTPGPVFTTATFVGYVVGGFTGAVLATIAIFLPAFVFVAIVGPLVPRLRQRAVLGRLLDGVNVAAIGLMAAVTIDLGRDAIVDLPTALLAIGSAYLLIRHNVNSAWLVVLGGVAGLLLHSLR
ncbi:MAG: chromate transporter [Thermomicrobiales bacterium]|jgi:chromate transporter|nr:chromate transporter [Thermomicrobiales bacterium]